jgi:hypothetical protein
VGAVDLLTGFGDLGIALAVSEVGPFRRCYRPTGNYLIMCGSHQNVGR